MSGLAEQIDGYRCAITGPGSTCGRQLSLVSISNCRFRCLQGFADIAIPPSSEKYGSLHAVYGDFQVPRLQPLHFQNLVDQPFHLRL